MASARQFAGNPNYEEILTGQKTLSGNAADQFAATYAGLRQLWVSTPTANGNDVFMGNSTSNSTTGTPIPPGQRLLVPLGTLTVLYFHGTASDVVAFEAYR